MNRDDLIEILKDADSVTGQNVEIRIDYRIFDFRVQYDDWGTYLIPLNDKGNPLMPSDLEDRG